VQIVFEVQRGVREAANVSQEEMTRLCLWMTGNTLNLTTAEMNRLTFHMWRIARARTTSTANSSPDTNEGGSCAV
jgi:hypothetical protein